MEKLKVLVLFGGQSSEHSISELSATNIISNLNTDKYELYLVGITQAGKWYLYEGDVADIKGGLWEQSGKLTPAVLLVQGIATSIDALSVGFALAEYNFTMALAASLLIAAVTFILCTGGLVLGKKAGMKLADKATIIGGIILIAIGIEIFLSNIL